MQETEPQKKQILIRQINTVNENSAPLDLEEGEFATLQGTYSEDTTAAVRFPGKVVHEKFDAPLMGIHQFWTAFGYAQGISQTPNGIFHTPENPPNDEGDLKDVPIIPPGVCKLPVSSTLAKIYVFAPSLFLEPTGILPYRKWYEKARPKAIRAGFNEVTSFKIALNKKASFVLLKMNWTQCDGTDFDAHVKFLSSNFGASTTQTMGYFSTPEYRLNLGDVLLGTWLGDNTAQGYEGIMLDIAKMKEAAGTEEINAVIGVYGNWYANVNFGRQNVELTEYLGGHVTINADGGVECPLPPATGVVGGGGGGSGGAGPPWAGDTTGVNWRFKVHNPKGKKLHQFLTATDSVSSAGVLGNALFFLTINLHPVKGAFIRVSYVR